MHHCFDDNGVFQNQHGTHQIVRTAGSIHIHPQMSFVFESCGAVIDDLLQFSHRNGALSHPQLGVLGDDDCFVKTHAEHQATLTPAQWAVKRWKPRIATAFQASQ
jgi:hypothetical protein